MIDINAVVAVVVPVVNQSDDSNENSGRSESTVYVCVLCISFIRSMSNSIDDVMHIK